MIMFMAFFPPKSRLTPLPSLNSGNRKWRQTGSRQSIPLLTILTRYGNSVSTPLRLKGLAKPSRILSERIAHSNFQYRPHIVDTDTIADAAFADAVSESSMNVICPALPG